MSGTRILSAICALAILLLAVVPAAEARKPRPIVYAVVIDGLDGDIVDSGAAPFISSLLRGDGARAAYYRESRSVMIAETNPNHTAMMTGAYGDRSGIPGNAFALYAPLRDEDSCVARGPVDDSKPPTATSGESSECLQAQTVFEALKRQGNPDGLTTAAILGKPKLGRIFSGRRFSSRSRDVDYLWAPCASGDDDDAYCESVPTNPVTGYAVDDATVMNSVIRSMSGVGSPRRRPDFTFVNLPQVDSAGHATGTGPVYRTAVNMADQQVQRLVSALRSRGEWSRTVLMLLSDHSMDTTLAKTTLANNLRSSGVPEDRFTVVQNGSVDMIYLNNRRAGDRDALLRRMRQAALGAPGVTEALYRVSNPADGGARHTLAAVHPGWHMGGSRAGDLIVTHDPGGAFSDPGSFDNPLVGNHGGPHTRDNFFAVTGGGPFVRQVGFGGRRGPLFDDTLANPGQAENVDVAPTVMGMFGLFAPRESAGRFLGEAIDGNALPGKASPSTRPRLRVRRVVSKRRAQTAARTCRGKRIRFRVRYTPAGGRYDLWVQSGKRVKRLLSRSTKTRRDYVGKRGKRYRFIVRMRAASGVAGPKARKLVRAPRCRPARKAPRGRARR